MDSRKVDFVEIHDSNTFRMKICPESKDAGKFVATGGVNDAILFDTRITHRGGANKTPHPRPMMYVSYVRDWWQDSVNFKQRHTRNFDELSTSQLRRLLTRVDREAYIKSLEDLVVKKAGSKALKRVRSRHLYDVLTYKVDVADYDALDTELPAYEEL